MSSRNRPGVNFPNSCDSSGSCVEFSSTTPTPPAGTPSNSIVSITTGDPHTAVGASASTSPASQASTTTATQSSTASPIVAAASSSNAGTIAGCVVGGVVFLVLVVLGILLYLRARKRNRTPPSSEFMNSLRAGAKPILRLDSGVEYTPTLPEKGGGHTHYPPAVPLPFMQNSYYTSPPMQNMKFPDELMISDVPSGRPSVEIQMPQRFSLQHQAKESFVAKHHPSASVGSRRELWGSETESFWGELSPTHQSPPRAGSVLHFAPRMSLDETSTQPSYPSRSPTSLQPLRRRPDLETTD